MGGKVSQLIYSISNSLGVELTIYVEYFYIFKVLKNYFKINVKAISEKTQG